MSLARLLNFHKLFLRRTLVRLQHRSAKKPDVFLLLRKLSMHKSATQRQLHKEQKYGPKIFSDQQIKNGKRNFFSNTFILTNIA